MSVQADISNTPRGRVTTIGLCFLVAVLEGYNLQIISSAGPSLQASLHLSQEQMGVFFSSTLVGLALGSMVGGSLADRLGRKPVLVWSVFALGLFTFSTAFTDSYALILLSRILAGVGLGGAMPTLIALMAELSGGQRTTSAVTTMITGQPLGGILSGMLGHVLVPVHGWQSLFLFGGMADLLMVPMLLAFLPETHAVGAARKRTQMPYLRALFSEGRAPVSLMLWALFMLTLALLSVLLSWTPLLVIGKGLPRFVGINAIIAINVGGILGGLCVSRLIDRFGLLRPMLTLYALMTVSLYLFAHTQTPGSLMLVAALVGFSVLGTQFSLYGIAPRLYPPEGRGAGVGFSVALGRVGAIIGPIVVGGMVTTGRSNDQAVLMLAPVALIAGLALIGLNRSSRAILV